MGRTFILDAGFSRHITSGKLPVMTELATELHHGFPWIAEQTDSPKFNLEKLWTWVDLAPWPLKDLGAPGDPEQTRMELKRWLAKRLDIPADDGWRTSSRELCRGLFRQDDVVLTFNYDCVLEHLLWQEKLWTPHGGYGESPGLSDASKFGLQIQRSPVVILKLHGSLNFELKTTGSDVYLSPRIDNNLFPEIHTEWGHYPETPTLTLPTFAKVFGENRTMIHLWHEAAEFLKNTTQLFIIGYSMPRSDTMARFLLSFFRPAPSSPGPSVVILTNDEAESTLVWKQVYEVAGFAPDLIEPVLLAPASDAKYQELLAHAA